MDGEATRSVFNRPQPAATPTSASARTAAPQPPIGSTATVPDAERQALEAQRRRGAHWFYWIAGLSFINAVLVMSGQRWRFLLGLGVTELVQELAKHSGGAGVKAGIVGLGIVGCFAAIGQRALAGYRWAFVLGMVLYALDGSLFLLVRDWPAAAFHAFALVMIGRGYVAARRLPSA